MRLIIFDVDGTLTDTMAVDARCFLRSFAEVFGFADVDPDWSLYKNATDAGIVHEVFESRTGRAPSEMETARFREHLVASFRSASQEAPFAAVAGARELLARLGFMDAYQVALATGCWRDSARVKMASAGMSYDDYPSASADDAPDRESIIKLAIERASRRVGGNFSGAVYVGDGVWDARACRNLNIPFVGIGAGAQGEKLAGAGAARIFHDLSDADSLLASMAKILPVK
jgi:phosphoglycolate phosphatase-like HAD superfamily hydrolase